VSLFSRENSVEEEAANSSFLRISEFNSLFLEHSKDLTGFSQKQLDCKNFKFADQSDTASSSFLKQSVAGSLVQRT
jgi:hypothetical protein